LNGSPLETFFLAGPRGRRKRLALDTCCFIYHFEARPKLSVATTALFRLVEQGRLHAVASVLAAAEVRAGVRARGARALEATYATAFRAFPHLVMAPITLAAAERAGDLRARYRVRMPDALHLAAALEAGADAFVTNDRRLRAVPEIEVLLLRDAK
jgi:predicted nucleic acid-binding protein